MSGYIEIVSECVQIPKKELEQLRAELEAAKKTIAEYEARKCENCSHLDKCNHSIIYRPMRAQIILSSCSAFEPKGE